MSQRNVLLARICSTVDVASGRFAYLVGTLSGIAHGLWIIHFRVIQESPLLYSAWMQPPLARKVRGQTNRLTSGVTSPLQGAEVQSPLFRSA